MSFTDKFIVTHANYYKMWYTNSRSLSDEQKISLTPLICFFSLDIFTVKHLWDQVQSHSLPILNYCERINMTNMQFLCFCQEDECIIPSYPNKEMKTWPISWDSSRLYNLIFTFHLIEEMNDRPILP